MSFPELLREFTQPIRLSVPLDSLERHTVDTCRASVGLAAFSYATSSTSVPYSFS